MREMAIAGEKVSTEEQLPAGAIESTMTSCVAGKVNDRQTMPYVQYVPIVEQARWSELPESQKRSPYRLNKAGDYGSALIRWTTLVVRCIKARRCDPCPCLFRNPANMENVIEMTMCHNDSHDGLTNPSPLQCLMKKLTTSDKSSVDKVES